jgi:hypothetical protein
VFVTGTASGLSGGGLLPLSAKLEYAWAALL